MRILQIFLLFLIVTGCKNSPDFETIHIDVNNNVKKTYSEVAKTTTFIPLATDSNCMISEVSKIYVSKDKMNILDKRARVIYTFDKNGKFLFKTAHIGTGKGQYMRIDDFEINGDGSVIELLDGTTNKLLTYSGGSFLSEKALPFQADAFAYSGDKLVFHRDLGPSNPNLAYQVIVTDKNFAIMDRYLQVKKTSSLVFAPQNPLQRQSGSISLLPIYSPYVYSIKPSGVYGQFYLDFGKNWMTDDFIYSKTRSTTFAGDLARSDYVYFLNTVAGDNELAISFTLKHKVYTAIYDKSKKELSFIKDLHSSYCGDFGFQAYQQHQFVSVITPGQLLASYKKGLFKQGDRNMDKIVSTLKSESNPVIMMTTFQL